MSHCPTSDHSSARHVFLDDAVPADGDVAVGGDVRHHLANVVRLRPGERVVLRDNAGVCRVAVVREIERHSIVFAIVGDIAPPPPPPCRITVVQAPGRGDRFERVLQHGTEIGVARFVPLVSHRCVAMMNPDPAALAQKMRRWNAVLRSAAEQSRRNAVPELLEPMPLPGAIDVTRDACLLLLDQRGKPIMDSAVDGQAATSRAPSCGSYALFVGPEGGFTDQEKALLARAGAISVCVTLYVLRTETAALAAASVLIAQAMAQR